MEKTISSILGFPGRLLHYSKSGYRDLYPENFVIFNANLCTKSEKIWYGDIDLTLDKNNLLRLAKELGEDLYVLYEMDGRFENEECPKIEKAAAMFSSDGNLTVSKKYSHYNLN